MSGTPHRFRIATAVVATASIAALSMAAAPGASASAAPIAQSVGRLVDGSVGGNAIQTLADVKDARAYVPGITTVQNPLDANLLNNIEVPLTGALQLPSIAGINLGAANQLAVAKSDGYSYGAAGAVSNSGGVSIGASGTPYPSDAQFNLDASALPSLPTLPIPGGSPLGALGTVSVKVGAVSALAQTLTGGKIVPLGSNHYEIAGLKIVASSPALGGLLSTLASQSTALTGLLAPVTSALGAATPASCSITSGTLPATMSLDSGAVKIDAATGSLTIDVAALLQTLHLNLNTLAPNTDLLKYLLANLPTILSTGLENVVTGIVNPLETAFAGCVSALGPLAGVLGQVLTTLTTGQATIESTINTVVSTLSNSAPGGLGALADGLKQLLDIGVNVQSGPGAGTTNTTYPFASHLKATADQAVSPVAGQTVIRAIEVDVLGAQVAAVSLANASAGPNTAVVAPTPTPTTTSPVNPTTVPTAVSAGQANHGMPAGPVVLLVLGLGLAAAGAVAYRFRSIRFHG
jgi:hypothetical protein